MHKTQASLSLTTSSNPFTHSSVKKTLNKKMAMKLSNLPEPCLANIISFTTPIDACRFTTISTLFHSAADSDNVWERFLLHDLLDIIAQSDDVTQNQLLEMLCNHSKKQIFMKIADFPIIIDSGRKSFFVDKLSGKKCYMISAREMSIVWSDTPRYWSWVSVPDSRFKQVAELLDVCWLEMSLKIEASLLSPKTTYVAYLVFKLTDNSFGLDFIRPETSVGICNGVKNTKRIFFESETNLSNTNSDYPKQRIDGSWMEVELGEVFVAGGDDFVEVRVEEVKRLHWKSGLVVEGVEFRPRA